MLTVKHWRDRRLRARIGPCWRVAIHAELSQTFGQVQQLGSDYSVPVSSSVPPTVQWVMHDSEELGKCQCPPHKTKAHFITLSCLADTFIQSNLRILLPSSFFFFLTAAGPVKH